MNASKPTDESHTIPKATVLTPPTSTSSLTFDANDHFAGCWRAGGAIPFLSLIAARFSSTKLVRHLQYLFNRSFVLCIWTRCTSIRACGCGGTVKVGAGVSGIVRWARTRHRWFGLLSATAGGRHFAVLIQAKWSNLYQILTKPAFASTPSTL